MGRKLLTLRQTVPIYRHLTPFLILRNRSGPERLGRSEGIDFIGFALPQFNNSISMFRITAPSSEL